MIITTQVTENYNFSGYEQTEDCKTVSGQQVCDQVYTIYNEATREFKDKTNNSYTGKTEKVSTKINSKLPTKSVNATMINYEEEFKYTIKSEVPAAGYQTSSAEPTSFKNGLEPYNSNIFASLLKATFQTDNTIKAQLLETTQEENSQLYYESYVFTDTLEAPLQIKNKDNVTIKNSAGTDVTDWFDVLVNGQTVTATLKSEHNTADFYGTRGTDGSETVKTYTFELTVSLRDNAENIMDMSTYLGDDGVYTIPNKASITTKTPGNSAITRDTNVVQVYYYTDPEPYKMASDENITSIYTAGKTYTYTIMKDVLSYDDDLKYSSFVFSDTLENCLEASSSLEIVNEADTNVTDWFDISVSGQTITATLKSDNNNGNFYGHTYYFTITTKVKDNYDLSNWKRGDNYVIPNYGTFKLNNSVEMKTNNKEVYITLDKTTVTVPKTAANIPALILIFGGLLMIAGASGYLYVLKKKKA